MKVIDNVGQDLSSRLERLERSNRRLRITVVGAMVAITALFLAGFASRNPMQGVQREIQTQRLVIVGSDNQPRVMLQGNSDGSALFLYGPDQPDLTDPRGAGGGAGAGGAGGGGVTTGFSSLAPRLRLMVEGEECRIELIAPGGTTRAKLRYNADGPALEYFDSEGNPIAHE